MRKIEVCCAVRSANTAQQVRGGALPNVVEAEYPEVAWFAIEGDERPELDERVLLRKYLSNVLAVYAKAKHPSDDDKFIAELVGYKANLDKAFPW
jgi:hypothetical protein